MQEIIHRKILEAGLSPTSVESRSWAQIHLQADDSSLNEYFGDGPLDSLLQDPQVTEILVNGAESIWTERSGKLSQESARFSSDESLRRYVRRILSTQGKKIDQLQPFADAVLHGRFRLHVAMNPISELGLVLSIRKFPEKTWSLDSLLSNGMLSEKQFQYLRTIVQEKRNIFIAGQTGSGKTTLLSALIGEVPVYERILALEDISELRSDHPHFLKLITRVANGEGEGGVDLKRLLKESLRMRPDRLVIGECRGDEALDLTLALSSGHHGSMGTIHAGSPREALQRLEMLSLLGRKNVSEQAVRSLICSCLQVLLYVQRLPEGRKLVSIAELKGQDQGNYLLREIKF